MFRLIQVTLPGALFFLIVLQYKQVEGLKAANEQLKARLHAHETSPDSQVKEAMQLAAEGKKAEAVSKLKILSEEFPTSPAALEARKRAALIEEQAAKARAQENARRNAQQNKKDLEKFLDISSNPEKPAPKPASTKELQVPNCRKLESDSNKYAGKRVSITDSLEKLDNFYNFSDCSGIRISTERLDKEALAALQSKLAGKDSAPVAVSGEYSGLVLYLDKIK